MIFETHAHYDDKAFDEDRTELLCSLKNHGIGTVITVGADLESTKRAVELAEQYPFLYAAAGVHPEACGTLDETGFTWLEQLVQTRTWVKNVCADEGIPKQFAFNSGQITDNSKIVAVGEIGLDYYWNTSEKEIQKKWFRRQLALAVRESLPVIIHSRDAAQDTLELLREASQKAKEQKCSLTGVIHCYSYSPELAGDFLSLGFYLGIGGVVTFKNAKKLLTVVAETPLNRLLLETDSPYLAPVPNRGKRNSSLNLPLIAEKIAELKNVTTDEVIQATEDNARQLFFRTEEQPV